MAKSIFNETAQHPIGGSTKCTDLQDLIDKLAMLDATYSMTCLENKAAFDQLDVERQNWLTLSISRMVLDCRQMAEALRA